MIYTFLEVAPNYIGFFIAIYTLNVTFCSSCLENLEKVSQQRAGYHLVVETLLSKISVEGLLEMRKIVVFCRIKEAINSVVFCFSKLPQENR
jgi:hypothetical protein